ncbi:BglG family transcription antiterminator [Carnobacterium gallinarum]|uniref:BglG family transcription antiterminator n=1 Tax=Carnobacterium gallinarum TaxID=2749 RepID=UPI0005500641|nr:PRD domain-containing protein [Carnobacterium gallinarum]
MQLESNFQRFLVIIAKQKEITNITALANSAGLSRRMIYYYIDKVNDLFKSAGLSSLSKEGRGGFSLNLVQQKQIKEWLKNQKQTDSILKTSERRLLITLLILLENKKWQLNHFQNLFLVSRNTILKDIQWVKEQLAVSEVEVKSNKTRGYYVSISELERRQLIYQQLYVIEMGQKETTYYFLLESLGFTGTKEKYKKSLQIIKELFEATKLSLGKEIPVQDMHILAKLIFILQERNQRGLIPEWTVEEEYLIKERLEYQVTKKLLKQMKTHIQLDYFEDEALYYGMLLLCVEKNADAHFRSNPFENLIYVTENLVLLFEQIGGIHFHNRESLIKKIQTHLKVLYYRHLFSMQMPSLISNAISTNYQKVFKLTDKISALMKSDLIFQNSFPDGLAKEEIAEIAIFFEEAILREQTKQYIPQLVIVSDFPDVMNSLLENHIRQLLPNSSIVGILKSDSANFFPGKVDYCISTDAQYVHHQGETLNVSIILSSEEKKRIKKLDMSIGNLVKIRKKLIHLMTKYGYLQGQEDFIEELENIFQSVDKVPVSKESVHLNKFLQHTNFCLVMEKATDLDELVEYLAEPLLEEEYIQPMYLQQVKKELAEKRYVFLYPQVMLLHTDYRFGSMELGCSFLYLQEAFQLDTSEKVRFIIFLATEENMGHVPLLFELDELLKSECLSQITDKHAFFS